MTPGLWPRVISCGAQPAPSWYEVWGWSGDQQWENGTDRPNCRLDPDQPHNSTLALRLLASQDFLAGPLELSVVERFLSACAPWTLMALIERY